MNKNPAYNLKAVLQDTGLKPDVLRAWERRYGLPNPDRTEGGHRLYSDYDVAILKWLIQRQSEGLSISRAVSLWREAFELSPDRFLEVANSEAFHQKDMADSQNETSLDSIRRSWINDCYEYNEVKAESTLNQAFAQYSVETVCTKVLQQGIAEIGMAWLNGTVTVQQEHYATAIAQRRLDSLLSSTPAPNRSQTILVGCPSGEWHTFTALLITLFLRRKGYNVIYLGSDVPSMRFHETIEQIKPSLVILSAQQLTSAASLYKLAVLLSQKNAPVCFGGRIFTIQPELRNHIAGVFLGESVEIAIQNVDSLLTKKYGKPSLTLPSQEFSDTLEHFLNNRFRIEAIITQNFQGVFDHAKENLVTANHFFGDSIIACLELGNLAYLNLEIDWLNGLLESKKISSNVIPSYLKSYHNAVNESIGEYGRPILNWINSHIKEQIILKGNNV